MAGWKVARLEDIPNTNDPSYWEEWAHDSGYGERWRSIRPYFGITGFGVNAYEADAGEELVVPHDEKDFGGQEELYFIARGRARFVLDGEEVEVGQGGLVFAKAEVMREARALERSTVVFMVGGVPGTFAPDENL
jgi:uncharacterized cupin superfamily protein